MKWIVILIFFSFPLIVSTQPSFSVEISTDQNELGEDLIEVNNMEYLLIGYSGNYWQPETCISFIYIINNWGDTIGKHYYSTDTVFMFHKLIPLDNGQYMVLGACANAPDYNQDFMTMLLSDDLEILSYKRFEFPWYDYITDVCYRKAAYSYYALASLIHKQSDYHHLLALKIDHQGDTLASYLMDDLGNGQFIGDIEISNNDEQIWIFGDGFNGSSRASRIVIDTNLNFLYSQFLPNSVSINMNTRWITDSTVLFATHYLNWGSNPQDDDIGISITDTSFLNLDFHFIGSIDTVDYPGWGTFIDFRSTDSIFYAGIHNIIFDFWPEWPSWIMFGQLNETLDKRFEYFYGGDAYYQALDIIATSDGGCLISALRYDYLVQDQENDIIVLKYNKEDLFTGISNNEKSKKPELIFYPNPARDILSVCIQSKQTEMLISDCHGKLIYNQKLNMGTNLINVSGFSPGLYFYRIHSDREIIHQGRWIKVD